MIASSKLTDFTREVFRLISANPGSDLCSSSSFIYFEGQFPFICPISFPGTKRVDRRPGTKGVCAPSSGSKPCSKHFYRGLPHWQTGGLTISNKLARVLKTTGDLLLEKRGSAFLLFAWLFGVWSSWNNLTWGVLEVNWKNSSKMMNTKSSFSSN